MGVVTEDGYQRDTFETILARVEARARGLFGAPNLDIRNPDGFLASVYLPLIELLAEADEVIEIAYNAIDPNRATRQSYAAVGALRGVTRKTPEVGTHPGVDMVFDAAAAGTVLRGTIRFTPQGQTENVWINSEDLSIPSANSYSVAVESELAGSSKILQDDATIEIVAGPTQLVSITVDGDATPGTDLEQESAWRARSDAALAVERSRVEIAVEDVPGVVSATVIETPGYVRVIVNDGGGGASDADIAAAIVSAKAQGVETTGAISVTANGYVTRFDRDSTAQIYVAITIKASASVSETDLKNAMIAEVPTQPGSTLIWGKLYAAAQKTANISDVLELLIGLEDPPTASENISIAEDTRFTLAAADIAVTVAP